MDISRINIALVDDDSETLRSLSLLLRTKGFNPPVQISKPEILLSEISKHKIDIVLLDLHMPEISGLQLLELIKKDFPDVIIIIITGDSQVEMAVKCTQLGAYDYFLKPVDHERLVQIIIKSVEHKILNNELINIQRHLLEANPTTHQAFDHILSSSDSIKQLFKYIEAIASSTRPVLILGETGTGKELFSQAVHNVSETQGKLVTVNVAGLDDTAFSDSLFGHTKGAFTGAHSHRDGLIKKAQNGTLFLDEIGDLKAESQIKLLRLLQEGNYYPLGSDQLSNSTARIVTATNKNLEELINDGEFRRDLYYRLHIHTITIPPLRERREDIPLLTTHFIKKACKELNKDIPKVSDELYTIFAHYQFLGNVRELEVLLFDACINTTEDTLNIQYIKTHIGKNTLVNGDQYDSSHEGNFSSMDSLPTIKNATTSLINEALKRTNNNQQKAAKILGISRQALNKRLTRK